MIINTFISFLGKIEIIVNDGFLIYCNWESSDCESKKKVILSKALPSTKIEEDKKLMEAVIQQLDEYFRGNLNEFHIPVKLSGTKFQIKVWEELKKISYGTLITYGELARKCGYDKAYRAVARACGQNPVSIIFPCHRIIGANNTLGGYTGGIEKKKGLLNIENQKKILNIILKKDKNGKIDLAE